MSHQNNSGVMKSEEETTKREEEMWKTAMILPRILPASPPVQLKSKIFSLKKTQFLCEIV